jgi:hypothetical protein
MLLASKCATAVRVGRPHGQLTSQTRKYKSLSNSHALLLVERVIVVIDAAVALWLRQLWWTVNSTAAYRPARLAGVGTCDIPDAFTDILKKQLLDYQ